MRKTAKRVITLALTCAMTFSLAGCGSKDDEQKGSKEEFKLTIDQIKLGEDYTNVKADLKFLTHKTDVIDSKFSEYIKEFQEMYPNVNIEYEGITDYATGITTRLSTGDWGDICMVPTNVNKDELSTYFVKLGDQDKLGESYVKDWLNNYTYQNSVYGMPSMINAQGIVYNKKVFADAGISEVPKTPDEFLGALKKIKDKFGDKVVPMYTNFAADWTMTAWDAYLSASTGDADFINSGLTKGKDPFADRGDGTGPYAVYNVLYEAVKQGLTEEDPTTTDWEGCKPMINNGEIGCMVLGSWAFVQMRDAGENGDDIAYMPFPLTINGKQYSAVAPDYNYGINVNSSEDEKIAAMCYIKWLVEQSGFAGSEGGISVVQSDEMPDALASFDSVELLVEKPAASGEESLFNDINSDSELAINVSGVIPKEVLEAAVNGDKTMEDMSKEWNERWTNAQKNNGVE